MDPSKDGKPVEQIIIIRRRSGGEGEDHHGGVWKIAFADFMTAMMAFFLVMWLVNATDQQTLTQVATYFSPIRLTDRVASPKGVNDIDESGKTSESSPKDANDKNKKKAKGGKKGPPAKDADHKASDKAKPSVSGGPDPQAKSTTAAGGAAAMSEGKEAQSRALDPFDDREVPRAAIASAAAPEERPAERPAERVVEAAAAVPKPAAETDASTQEAPGKQGAELAREIQQAIANVGLTSKRGLEVQETPEGVLISLTDELDFGMFQVSSAEPTPQLVSALEEIGRLLTQMPGMIHVRGHSDNRQFRSARSDNWQLSSQRAYAAFQALARGGIANNRFERIEAYADRRPRNVAHRDAAENRRIEILVLRPQAPAAQTKAVRP